MTEKINNPYLDYMMSTGKSDNPALISAMAMISENAVNSARKETEELYKGIDTMKQEYTSNLESLKIAAEEARQRYESELALVRNDASRTINQYNQDLKNVSDNAHLDHLKYDQNLNLLQDSLVGEIRTNANNQVIRNYNHYQDLKEEVLNFSKDKDSIRNEVKNEYNSQIEKYIERLNLMYQRNMELRNQIISFSKSLDQCNLQNKMLLRDRDQKVEAEIAKAKKKLKRLHELELQAQNDAKETRELETRLSEIYGSNNARITANIL